MSFLEAILTSLQSLGYITVACTAAVCYDYILTFSPEVDLIWGKSWSMMSILFIVARYLGLSLAICTGLWSGTGVLYMSQLACAVILQFLQWGGFVYTVVTKGIMILRVAAMFKHPKRSTYILSFLYLLIVIETFVVKFLYEGPQSGLIISNITLADVTLCDFQLRRSVIFLLYGDIPGLVFDLLVLVLSLYRFVAHSLETRRMLGRANVNVYMRLLFEHSVLYFLFNVLVSEGLMYGMVAPPTSASEWMTYGTFVFGYCSVVPYVLYPRLVLSFKGHRSQSDGLYTGGNAPQHSYSYPAPYGGPGSRVYELMDLNSLGRLSRSTQWSQREGPELVKLPELVHY